MVYTLLDIRLPEPESPFNSFDLHLCGGVRILSIITFATVSRRAIAFFDILSNTS